jgi:DNA-directed RNA polymerase subunit K/omega
MKKIKKKSGENYLDLVEAHTQNQKINLFEKIRVVTKRAKSLYSLEASARKGLKHKPTYQAILECNEGRLIMKKGKEEEEEWE